MRLKTFILIFTLLTFSVVNLLSQHEKSIQDFLNTPSLRHASIGFSIKDFEGKTIASYNAEQSLTPASILKVITTASALEILGANYRYETLLKIEDIANKPLKVIIKGSGDPTLGTEFLDNTPSVFIDLWSTQIATSLKSKKDLEIYVIDDLFGYQGVSRKWIYEDIGNYYGGGSYGISIFDNTYKLSFNTEDGKYPPKIIGTFPRMENLRFINTLTLNTSGRDNGYIIGSPFSNERLLIGNIPTGRKKFTIKGAIPNPGLFLGEIIGEAMSAKGFHVIDIKTSQEAYFDSLHQELKENDTGRTIHKHLSPALSSIIKDINVRSNNHYSEHLIRTIGAQIRANYYSSALDEGINGISGFWESKGISSSALFMHDGCGLAPTNALSANFMCTVLTYMQKNSQNSIPFLQSFPKAGEEGTVRNLLKGTRLQGKVYAKSGSIANVQCFAGYYIDGEKKYSFCVMVNKFKGTNRQVIQAIEKLLLATLK